MNHHEPSLQPHRSTHTSTMANNDNNDSRRSSGHPEDNPFIAFRRYADSQVSSLLNTVFTLPAQIASYNSAHRAREQCLFRKADSEKCEELEALVSHSEKLRHEGTESCRAGDVKAVLRKGEQLIMLEQRAGELRRAILNDAEQSKRDDNQQKQQVEQIGHREEEEWSESWEWPDIMHEEQLDEIKFAVCLRNLGKRVSSEIERIDARLEEDARKWSGEDIEELRRHGAARHDDTIKFAGWLKRLGGRVSTEIDRIDARFEEDATKWFGEDVRELRRHAAALYDDINKREDKQTRNRYRSWSWQWPPPADAPKNGRSDAPDDSYSPSALEANERTKHVGSMWRNAFEDLMRTTQEHPLLSDTQNSDLDQMGLSPLQEYAKELKEQGEGNSRRLLKVQESARFNADDEPGYEYAHDHEDQHDDPPTPKPQQTAFPRSSSEARPDIATELDAYERLLTPQAISSLPNPEVRPTILSTFTTTERTTAPDGTITTKVVLKKRFADGSEQSSESVHTQHGEVVHRSEDSQRAMQNAQASDETTQSSQKKRGWFWSD